MATNSTDSIERIVTEAAPSPSGHYVQATAWSDLVFISGQLPVRPDGSHTADLVFEDQARQALANLLAVLAAAGSDPGLVLKVTAYITGVEHWPTFNRVFADAFADARPARAVVPVPALHHGYLIEIEAIAGRRLKDEEP
ncbi:RidA family protein [Telmatospirillum sp.]|uniref:RidA family protein n=1 Tax=Telmatospirillum sp. TaxID=2079197 RepID=UPI0028465395|nr:RidA family protein [Telmatospirillum sp.]MDR3435280.1 RidA family protein [Telmatospirillum sp.]